jgi:hypothetical protein
MRRFFELIEERLFDLTWDFPIISNLLLVSAVVGVLAWSLR